MAEEKGATGNKARAGKIPTIWCPTPTCCLAVKIDTNQSDSVISGFLIFFGTSAVCEDKASPDLLLLGLGKPPCTVLAANQVFFVQNHYFGSMSTSARDPLSSSQPGSLLQSQPIHCPVAKRPPHTSTRTGAASARGDGQERNIRTCVHRQECKFWFCRTGAGA